MKNLAILILVTGLFGFSCSSTAPRLFKKRTAHEAYAERLDDNGLEKTPQGRQWLAASKSALQDPETISLPFALQGYFQPDKPRALGLRFSARPGEQVQFTIDKQGSQSFVLYADLYSSDGSQRLLSVDTTESSFSFDVPSEGEYILRLQPQLERSGPYKLTMAIGPSLGFPVAGSKANVGSFWGANRDGGRRRHEGIDIFAPKRTPAIAAADGYIASVREGGIGGKTVWLRPAEKNISLYYAHLDVQLVQEGQRVQKGDTIGLVGNTGNAEHTPPHLHFGIYTFGGAVDPLPYVDRAVKKPGAVPQKSLSNYLRLTRSHQFKDGTVATPANTLLVPLAVTGNGYLSELPDGRIVTVPFKAVKASDEKISTANALANKGAPTIEKGS